jgi:xanthine dehydrogenase/oxidase
VKRLGGGFGGKETRSCNIASYAAIAAHHLNKPVRLVLERDVDMSITGQRHPFKCEYKVGFNKDGDLRGLDVNIYNNAGYSLDLSMAVMDRALFHIDGPYNWAAFSATGRCCNTNLPSNTAFRGFGGPQGMMFTEMIVERVANFLKKPTNFVREKNFYREGEKTHFGQALNNWTLPETWERLKERSEIAVKQQQVAAFNKQHRFKKRGIGCLPTKFGISFTYLPLNQGGALVHIYQDGSVLVSHGGTEMGQGLNTKMIQVAADELGIDAELVHVNETATDKVPNTSPTAASFSSDINGLAVQDACQKLMVRIKPHLADAKGNRKPWKAVVEAVYNERISLSATGFCKIEGIGYDFISGKGTPFRYFTHASAVSVVEIDTLTGDFTTISTDIVMDLGQSINPVIDIGQIEGAFVQGLGWCTMEEMVWGDPQHKWVQPGSLMSRGPGNYKLPSFNDTPIDFNVYLLRDRPNPVTLHSSKAVGEPPFFLAASVFFAIKEAIQAARIANGKTDGGDYFQLNCPATSERIRMACADDITERFVSSTAAEGIFYQTKGSY